MSYGNVGTYHPIYDQHEIMAGSMAPTILALCAVLLIGAVLLAAVREFRTA